MSKRQAALDAAIQGVEVYVLNHESVDHSAKAEILSRMGKVRAALTEENAEDPFFTQDGNPPVELIESEPPKSRGFAEVHNPSVAERLREMTRPGGTITIERLTELADELDQPGLVQPATLDVMSAARDRAEKAEAERDAAAREVKVLRLMYDTEMRGYEQPEIFEKMHRERAEAELAKETVDCDGCHEYGCEETDADRAKCEVLAANDANEVVHAE